MSNEEEFRAPDWIEKGDEGPKPITQRERRWLTIAFLVVFPFCIWAGWFEFGRAQEGNWRAWVYTFEWPFFAAVALIVWRKFMRGDRFKIPRPDLEKLARDEERDEK